MNIHRPVQPHNQPPLFDYFSTSLGVSELFPAVWGALEMLIGPGSDGKNAALDTLSENDAVRFSPLVAYILTTRINEPDLDIRCRVIKMIGDTLIQNSEGQIAPDEVRQILAYYLSQMRTRQIYSILQALVQQNSLISHAGRLMNFSPYAGSHLAGLAGSRQTPIDIRQQAIKLIGFVGFLDALSDLERIMIKLESRVNGQQAMPFAPSTSTEETVLLTELTNTIDILRSV